MTTQVDYRIGNDVIDQLTGLQADSSLHALRHLREKVVVATQGSYDTLFDPALEDIALDERLLVALYACRLSGAHVLAAHYRSRLEAIPAGAEQADPAQLAVAATGEPEQLPQGRLRAMLLFTRALTQRPVEGDKAALLTLPAAGISTPAVVALSQLIAFISYQVRVLAGLHAMQLANN
ncbi:CMD domain protein [Herbaspirillum sp. RTI4]|uniref:CMD domain protein n=1 Tax=Herbaspirillum sp. RTI4 TaxID=3048640 RepID=UPI002AB5422E|nr:CMD domain protein [Herbaspirillum sp. RTI4]MDY7578964.1 CMD domain protein [Herbaspirillum sp. RTI4]MEA9980895.1 CMD domain protein [Herbaspirillum sp. RTI4]